MIEFQNVTMRFGVQEVLHDIRLQINAGERVGIVGPNGAGKSTLFGLITGELSTVRGSVIMPRKTRLGYVRQQLRAESSDQSLIDFAGDGVMGLRRMEARIHAIEQTLAAPEDADAPPRDTLLRELGDLQTEYEHAGGYDVASRAAAMLCGLGFAPDALQAPLSTFSGGWRMRASLVRALVGHPDILLLDEPSNYLDLPAIEWLQRYLREFAGTLLLISHDRYLLRELTTTTVEVRRGDVTRYPGGFDYYQETRKGRVAQQEAASRNQARKVEKIERFIERFRATSTKASQVQSRIKELERMDDIAPPESLDERAALRLPSPPRCGHEVLRIEDVGVTYDSSRWVLSDVSLRLVRGDRIALVGYNGMGKTTLLRVIAGRLSPGKGRCVTGHNVVVGYQSQEFAETMPADHSVLRIVRDRAGAMTTGQLQNILGSFGFSGDDIHKRCEVLSGGEKIRLAFARLFVDPPNLLLLDEPTTHLDMAGREALEEALNAYPGTVCFVSHDVEFVRGIARSIVELSPAGVRTFVGDYDYYRSKIAEDSAQPASVTATDNEQQSGTSRKEQRRQRAQARQEKTRATRALRRRLGAIEDTIENLEAEKASLVDRLGNAAPDVDFAELNRRLGTIEQELQRYTEEWDTVTDKLAGEKS